MISHTVPHGVRPMPLSRYVARAWPLLDAREAFRRRDVKVNGARSGGDSTVAGGDVLQIYLNPAHTLDVLSQGGGLLAVVKPQGLPVDVDAEGIGADTALTRARAIDPGARLCHRLDAQTGGVLLFATEDNMHARCLAAFRARAVRKRYAAIVAGAFSDAHGEYRDRLAKDAARARVHVGTRGERMAHTRWFDASPLDGGLTRVHLEPVTGRTHQLRAQMAHHAHPILGDDQYGDRALNRRFRTRLCLWCEHLSLLGLDFYAKAPDWLKR
ncbi:MAG: RluA family pseudouridine synthase [Christensenellales bacterium]|jgi:23S rRNA-/tRNA-specific pseudouridylate synthase